MGGRRPAKRPSSSNSPSSSREVGAEEWSRRPSFMAPIGAKNEKGTAVTAVTPTMAMEAIATHRLLLAGNPNDANFCQLKRVLEGAAEDAAAKGSEERAKVAVLDVTKSAGEAAGLLRLAGRESYPLAWVKGVCAGGLAEVVGLEKSGRLLEWLSPHDYDLVVVGGGSGGLAAAKEAAMLGAKVAVLDFVKPSPLGTTWGLGGTCVNVGCIPKKLMHQASILGKTIKDAKTFGWEVPDQVGHSWPVMKDAIQRHISQLNWGYKVELREKSVTYLNSYGSFVGPFTLKATDKRGKEKLLTADRFLVAVGLRPKYPDIPGAKEYAVTSDDLFSLPYLPGKTLCVGASYISLECGGFLAGLGMDVTVMVRSILLRGFDRDMADRIGAHMEEVGVKFIREAVPTKIEQLKAPEGDEAGLYKVTAKANDGSEIVGEYNTVCIAIGREARTGDLGLDVPGVALSGKSQKLLTRREQSISTPWIFGIGDVAEGTPELTPVAIQAGRLLARRLFGRKDVHMNYVNVPTTVFTPLEYGCCGLSEEEALEAYGSDDVEVFHNKYEPLELSLPKRDQNHSYVKLICRISDGLRILGLHITGPNAGEITQGYGLLLTMGARKADLDALVGIHPTQAEVFTTLSITKRDGGELKTAGC